MSRVRISLGGVALEAADRILAQTPLESYSELFNFLLRRYEQDFILACNGFLIPKKGQPGHSVPHSPQVNQKSDQISSQIPQPGQPVPHSPKSAKSMLMDFED